MKKIPIVFLAVFMAAASILIAAAAERDVPSENVREEELNFNSFLADLQEGELNLSTLPSGESRTVTYQFFDREGNDVTDTFLGQAAETAGEYKLYYMYLQNIGYAVKRTEYIDDRTKTVVEEIEQICTAVTGNLDFFHIPEPERNGRVLYRLEGTVTYDPVTRKIISASPVIRTNIYWHQWYKYMRPYTVFEINETPKIAADGHSATFEHYMKIYADFDPEGLLIGTLGYDSYSHSFIIETD